MDHRALRNEAFEVLMEGGSYRDVVEVAAAMESLDNAPPLRLQVPIRFRKRYEDMKKETDAANPDS